MDQLRPILVPVGGFLGAGKTRLIMAASKILLQREIRVAAVLNDQGQDLVDTQWLGQEGLNTAEVAGACFCCLFSDLIRSLDQLRTVDPAVVFIEPVGSCTDISATVLQPLKSAYSGQFRLAPFTVLVDPARARTLASGQADPQLQYLFSQQLLEADIIVWSKSDIEAPAIQLSGFRNLRQLSAKTGEGVAGWLSEVIGGNMEPGGRILQDIDYVKYAAAEASLGWLNWQATVKLATPLTPSMLGGPLFDAIQGVLREAHVATAHLKMIVRCESGYIEAAVCSAEDEPEVFGDLTASPALTHEITVNLRARANPEHLSLIAHAAFEKLPGTLQFSRQDCFQPSPPQPEVRFATVVPSVEAG